MFGLKLGRQSIISSGWRSPGAEWLFTLTASIFMLVLTACGQLDSDRENPITIPPPPTRPPTPAATPTDSQTQATPMPTATLMATIDATQAATPAAEGCAHPYFFEPAPEKCPLDQAIASAAAEQPFEHGVMIWLEDTDSVYVFYEDQRWQRFDDEWSEDQPESDPTLTPPEGLHQPIRGFGKVWREQPGVRDDLGWALSPELAFESMIQRQAVDEEGMKVTFLLTFNGQVFALVSRDQDEGDWVIAAS